MRPTKFVLLLVCASTIMVALQPALCWSNGGYSADPAHPDYGTHDWIAQHALDYLPAQEKQYIVDNLASYLYGTELPDRPASQDGIGDASTKHHIYFYTNSTLQDDSAAQRAREEYQKALTYLKSGDYANAAKEAGVMSHYIDDMGVFGHVMGAKTDWSAEDSSKHSSYETYVDARTGAYLSSSFDSYLRFDGSLATVSAYDAAKDLAYNTTFGDNGAYTCTWVNSNYDWSNPAFKNRCGEELNLATNTVADVLHMLFVEALPTSTVSPTATPTVSPTPTTTLTPSPTPTTPGTPSPTPTPTEMYTNTPTTKTTPTATPTVPEFPIAPILVGSMLTILLIAFICLKTQKTKF